MKKRLIFIVFLILLLGVGAMVYVGQKQKQMSERYYSGTIEATQSNLAFQVSGRVEKVLIDEGQAVRKDQCLAQLDNAEFIARCDQARANLNRSLKVTSQLEVVLALYRATLPAAVEKAEASVSALRSQLRELESGYRKQEIERARLALESAQYTLEEARRDKHRFETLYQKRVIAEKDKDKVDLRFETVLKEVERAQKEFDLLREGFRQESIEAARSKLNEGRAYVKQSRSELKKIEAAEIEVEAAKAQVKADQAALALAEIQLTHTCLKAPFDGILTSRNIESGEVVSPDREVLTLTDLSKVELKIFVPENEIGRLKPGQTMEVKTDSHPQKKYFGRISFISSEAEFTPKFIQTHKERVKLVYLVKIIILNPDWELKPGMPADAWLQ